MNWIYEDTNNKQRRRHTMVEEPNQFLCVQLFCSVAIYYNTDSTRLALALATQRNPINVNVMNHVNKSTLIDMIHLSMET